MKIIVKSLALVLVGLTSLVALEVNDKANEQQIVKVKVKKEVENKKQEAKELKEDEKLKAFKDSIKK
ncbi:hypothetical protein ACH5BF_11625 [Arcobacter sp. YIC-464]|uniref:hypothetical protein n=1 Tax=Arcobacter sp. YIC-464 TaxID=3376631 RepID=UPI003C1DDB90